MQAISLKCRSPVGSLVGALARASRDLARLPVTVRTSQGLWGEHEALAHTGLSC